MLGKRGIAAIADARARAVVLLLALFLAAMPGLGLAQDENSSGNSLLARTAGLIPWETMFGWVQIPGMAEALALAILVVFVAVLVWLCAVWWRSVHALKAFLRKIQAISRDSYGFAEHYRNLEVDNRFAGIKHAWNEFRGSFFPEKDGEERFFVYNTVPPENFFTLDKLGMNFAAFRSLANYFVGVGLLLTFFGLAAALFEANKSIAGGGDVETTKKALGSLLKAATLKFMTSIAGLLSSIILSVFVLMASRHVARLCAGICEELEARVRFAVQERFAMLQLRELREQTVMLKTFSTDLAISIADRIAAPVSVGVLNALKESGLPGLTKTMGEVSGNVKTLMGKVDNVSGKLDSLAGEIAGKIAEPVKSGVVDAMKPLEEEIKELANKVVEGGKEGVKEIAKDIPGIMKKAANTIDGASKALQSAAGNLQKISSGLEGQIGEAGKAFGDKMKEASGGVANTVSGIKTQVVNLQNAVNTLGGILDGQRAKFQELADATESAASALNLAADRHARAAQPVADAAGRISGAADTIRNLGEVVQNTHQSLAKLHEHIENSNAELRGFWEEHDGRFAGVDEKLGVVVQKIVAGNNAYQASVTKFVTELAQQLEVALGKLSGAIGELSEVADEFKELRAGTSARGGK